MNMIEAQISPGDSDPTSDASVALGGIESFFNIVFIVELLVNMFGTLFSEFFADVWNWFDTVVVTVSLVSMLSDGVPGITVLRLARAFRVFRLFKRIESLNKIILALGNAFPPMLNAFVLVFLIIAIFSIMAVTFYGEITEVKYLFGNFFNAMFTMWQIATKSNWMEIVRDSLLQYEPQIGTGIFFAIFILIIDQVWAPHENKC